MIARPTTMILALIGLLAAGCTPRMETVEKSVAPSGGPASASAPLSAPAPQPAPDPAPEPGARPSPATEVARDAPPIRPATALRRSGLQRSVAASIPEAAASAMPAPLSVRSSYLLPNEEADDAAFHALLVAGNELRGTPRMAAISTALGDLPRHSAGDPVAAPPETRALVQAPVRTGAGTDGIIDLACDYDWRRAAGWKDSLNRIRARDGAGADLGADSLGFITSERNLESALRWGLIRDIEAADILYVDLSGVSNGYLAEVVERLVQGLRTRDVRSRTDSLAVIRAISVFEWIGEYTLALTGPLFAAEAQAAPEGRC